MSNIYQVSEQYEKVCRISVSNLLLPENLEKYGNCFFIHKEGDSPDVIRLCHSWLSAQHGNVIVTVLSWVKDESRFI